MAYPNQQQRQMEFQTLLSSPSQVGINSPIIMGVNPYQLFEKFSHFEKGIRDYRLDRSELHLLSWFIGMRADEPSTFAVRSAHSKRRALYLTLKM